MIKIFLLFALTQSICFAQIKNPENPEKVKEDLEDLYFLPIIKKSKYKINLSGKLLLDQDNFGLTKRIISYPAIKIVF